MKFSYNWLKSLYPKIQSPEIAAESLTFHSFEVESVAKRGNDYVIDVSILPNRMADAAGHYGITKELAVIDGGELKPVSPKFKESSKKAYDFLSVRLDKNSGASRYSARVLESVKIGVSPLWLQERLVSCGLRPINVVVDITNYVMLETGQPLHAFDYERLHGAKDRKQIVVRKAKNGETMDTLGDDSKKLHLATDDIVITDAKNVIGLGGIKGGKGSEIHASTTRIVLEAATFDPVSIRRTSRRLGLRTDASIRFEHNLSPELTTRALNLAADLLCRLAGATVLQGTVDAYPKREIPKAILFSVKQASSLVGTTIPEAAARGILIRLGCQVHPHTRTSNAQRAKTEISRFGVGVKKKSPGVYLVTPPAERRDLLIEEDLIEEVIRIWGYDKIELQLPVIRGGVPKKSDESIFVDTLKRRLSGMGFCETQLSAFVGESELMPYRISPTSLYQLENPTSPEKAYLANIPAINFVRSIAENLRNFDEVKVFEIATAYIKTDKGPVEQKRLLLGVAEQGKDGREEFYLLKGAADALLESFGIAEHWYDDAVADRHSVWAHPFRVAEIKVGDETVGTIGELATALHEAQKSRARIVIAEFSLARLFEVAEAEREFRPIAKFPAIIRDVSLVVPAGVRIQDVENALWEAAPKILADTDLFDDYEGEGMPEGKKSLAFHLIFQSEERTLTDAEVNREFDKIVKAVKAKGWEVR